ncbi:MAG: hypothetical protein RR774_07460 [Acinetobacter sp.]
MKTKDLREKSVEELTALLDEQQLNQFRARIKTLLTEKQGNGQ